MRRRGDEAVVREYRGLAARYDQRWAFYVGATVRETVARLPSDVGDRLLDVACGTGAFLEAAAERFPATEISGVDISPDMLAMARGKLPEDATLLVASADALPFEDNRFATVVTTNAFHFFRRPQEALGEIRRVLRPGGALVLTDWCDDFLACRVCDRLLRAFSPAHHRIYGSAECRARLEAAGFDSVEVARYKISWLWGLMTATARKPS